ncbi:MAG: DegT/DnrJ/EryC1/StrS family aminotransferase [Candidatus Cyclobacteriaceae bacterium M3_2C_046]
MTDKKRNVRLFVPNVGQEELDNIKDSFDKSWIGLGRKVTEFEDQWSQYLGAKSSVALNSATSALHLSLSAFKFPAGKKVMVPNITFASTALAPVYNQLEPVFVDVDPETVQISVEDMEQKYTPDCVAVIPVHMGGHPAPMNAITDFAQAKNLKVVEDCAHTVGASYKGTKLGLWGDIGCFSFEEKKAMTTGDGGMMTSNDPDLLLPMKAKRWVGIDKDTWKRVGGYTDKTINASHWYYEIAVEGYKFNMNDLAASIGLAQLKKLDDFNQRRKDIVKRYMAGIKSLDQIEPMFPYEPDKYNYWIFGIRHSRRDDLIIHLKSRGIATSVHYMPLSLHPYFSQWDSSTPVAKNIWETFITLPLHTKLTDEDVDYVLEALHEFKNEHASIS